MPIDKAILGFPTLAYLPQYLSFFCIGILASRGNWFRTIPGSMGKWGFVTAVIVTFTLFIAALVDPPALLGNGTWQSAAYALWGLDVCCRGLPLLDDTFQALLRLPGKTRPSVIQTQLYGLHHPCPDSGFTRCMVIKRPKCRKPTQVSFAGCDNGPALLFACLFDSKNTVRIESPIMIGIIYATGFKLMHLLGLAMGRLLKRLCPASLWNAERF